MENDLNVILKILFSGQTKMEYLGFWVSCNGVETIDKKYNQ